MLKAPFNKLALGVKFRYTHTTSQIWVKIHVDLIAEWDENEKNALVDWVGQKVCCFADADPSELEKYQEAISEEVEVLLDGPKLESLRRQLRQARRNAESISREASRVYRADQDYIPYGDDDRDR